MMNIVINNNQYSPPDSCKTLSIRQFQAITEWNDKLKNFDTLEAKQQDKETALFLEIICAVDMELAQKTNLVERISFIKSYLEYINKTLKSWQPKPNNAQTGTHKYFIWQGNRMMLPLNNSNFEGQKMPMAYISAIEICEATDLYLSDAVKYAPLIVAILCRKKNEKYHENIAVQRAKNMYEVPLEILWELYHQLNQTHKYLRDAFPNCYATENKKTLKQQKQPDRKQISTTWNDLIISLANHKPSEIQKIEKINAYNFMRILNSKLKTI